MNFFGKRSDLSFFTQEISQEGEKRGFVYAWAEYYLQPQLDDIAHDPTLVYRSRVGLSATEKEEQFASNDNKFFFFFSVWEP